jgi:hypothetical protein
MRVNVYAEEITGEYELVEKARQRAHLHRASPSGCWLAGRAAPHAEATTTAAPSPSGARTRPATG